MNIMYLYRHEVEDEVDFICIHVEMASFRVIIVFFGMVLFEKVVAKFIMLGLDVGCLRATRTWI